MASHQYYPPDRVQTTPSGVEIEFYDAHAKTDDLPGQRRHYLANGQEPESVTSILGILDKPALLSWAHKIGVAGAVELAKDGGLPQDPEAAISAMARRELCFWQVRQHAADRGTLAHEDLVRLGAGEVPDIASYPPEFRGYVQGVCAWYADHRPQVLHQELLVASPRWGFAGRLDLLARFASKFEGVGLVDLKTVEKLPRDKKGRVKAPYREHALQLAAYDLAARECGYPASDFRLVVRVDSEGAYDCTPTLATDDDFLAVLACHRQLKQMRERVAA